MLQKDIDLHVETKYTHKMQVVLQWSSMCGCFLFMRWIIQTWTLQGQTTKTEPADTDAVGILS